MTLFVIPALYYTLVFSKKEKKTALKTELKREKEKNIIKI